MATPSSKVREPEAGNTAQFLDLAPQLCLRPGVQNVKTELAQPLQIRSGLQLVDN